MPEEKRILVNVGMKKMPFPINASSKVNPDGQPTVANISISARIMHDFEARWIDKFIHVVHQHRDKINTKMLRSNVIDYLDELKATTVTVQYDYPFFIEKTTPVSGEKCLVEYQCSFSAKMSSTMDSPKVLLRMDIPIITTDPASVSGENGGLFGQLSLVNIEVESSNSTYPEDLVDLADRHSLSPVYSYLSSEDKLHIIKKVHSAKVSSVVATDAIRAELSQDPSIVWYSVNCSNYGMLHTYSTVVGTEMNAWVPYSCAGEEMI